VPFYAHATDPRAGYLMADWLGRAVALDLLGHEEAMVAMTIAACAEAKKTGVIFDPGGLRMRMAWALGAAARRVELAGAGLGGRLAAAIAARLRGQAAELTDAQRERAIEAIETMITKMADEAGRPYRAGELDGIAAEAYRSAVRRVARERAQ